MSIFLEPCHQAHMAGYGPIWASMAYTENIGEVQALDNNPKKWRHGGDPKLSKSLDHFNIETRGFGDLTFEETHNMTLSIVNTSHVQLRLPQITINGG